MSTAETLTCLLEEQILNKNISTSTTKVERILTCFSFVQLLTKAFIAPAFLWWLNPGLFSLETYTRRGNSFPSVSSPPLWPRKTYKKYQEHLSFQKRTQSNHI